LTRVEPGQSLCGDETILGAPIRWQEAHILIGCLGYSRPGAVVATSFISREWQPYSTNGAQNAEASIGDALGSEVGFNVFREFLPDLLHRH
jgi:hypothetical protein